MHDTNNRGHHPGDVVRANVKNPLEDRESIGKVRPAVLVRGIAGRWRVMGLTTQHRFATSGENRTPVPDWRAVGLNEPSYLWGDKLTGVDERDLGERLGVADLGLAVAIIREVPRMTEVEVRDLLAAVLALDVAT